LFLQHTFNNLNLNFIIEILYMYTIFSLLNISYSVLLYSNIWYGYFTFLVASFPFFYSKLAFTAKHSPTKYRKTSLLTNGREGKREQRERERPEKHTGVSEGSKSRERARLEIGANRAWEINPSNSGRPVYQGPVIKRRRSLAACCHP